MIEFDAAKRETTLFARGLDMARANEIFDSPHLDQMDYRRNYGEIKKYQARLG